MENFYSLDQILPSEQPFVGNRALNLSQLWQRDYPVVPSFVIPAMAFWEFIDILGNSEPLLADLPYSSFHVDVDNPRQLQQVTQQIRQAIAEAILPPTWASALLGMAEIVQAPAMILHPSVSVQSAIEEMADYPLGTGKVPEFLAQGILESHIAPKQPEALAKALKRVWAEVFRARSLFYWERQGIELQQLNLAVLVQPVWEAIASGIIQADPTEWNIQATWGLSTALTYGEVLPDYYQLQPETGKTIASKIGSKTRAYRLNQGQESSSPLARNGLQGYVLSEEQQQQYALDEQHLQQLIEICQKLTVEVEPAFCLEWTIYQTEESSEPQLYLTQFIPGTKTFIPELVRGIAAAGGRVTAPAQVIVGEYPNLEALIPGRILVAQMVTPDWIPLLKKAAGIVTEQGGITSHAAIIARELGIPAVVHVTGITQLIHSGELILIDGTQGEVRKLRTEEEIPQQTQEKTLNSQFPIPNSQFPIPNSQFPIPNSQFPIATKLLVNLSQVQSLEQVAELPVDGVGLLRSEVMMLDVLENQHPQEWVKQGYKQELVERLAQQIVQFAATFAPRSILYRSSDWRSPEFQFLASETSTNQSEINPILGLRGTRRYLEDPTSFEVELAALALVYSYGYTNIQLMLPFVRAVEEFTFCRRYVEQAGLTDNPHFQLWMMAEVPSVVFMLPDYVKAGAQGISIGTNDLTQLLLAVDRDQVLSNSSLNGRHPAVLRAIQQLIVAARTAGIPCSICGQAPAQYPEIIDLLVEWGITSISVDVHDVESTYLAIARAEQRLLLEAVRHNKR
ncbi:MAG: response regulator [Symploca sp. SIO2C1]|nr:response regulator [Symploca sp. SIO2C1]